jgi:D-sedoheptulose 7-phosphate isomerase
MTFASDYLAQVREIVNGLDAPAIERMANALAAVRQQGGRLFVLGVGGGAANASHAVNDFRKLCAFEAYAPTDNVAELTARINDEGWEGAYAAWLEGSRMTSRDAVLVFSVGGGSVENQVSVNLVRAVEYARRIGGTVLGVVGRDGGFTAQHADACVIVPTVDGRLVTPHTEAFQAIVWHCLVSHPRLAVAPTKWESVDAAETPGRVRRA